ncbi:hypothetical protein [Micromonospora tulbaghiae]|uniref:hypothetical protein n=1 Tax=Micromonospora tulbaghiae TaxID=479978 RepID=UPI003EBD0A63
MNQQDTTNCAKIDLSTSEMRLSSTDVLSAGTALATDGTAADATWQILLLDTIAVVAYTAAVTWLARRRRIDQTVPALGLSLTVDQARRSG